MVVAWLWIAPAVVDNIEMEYQIAAERTTVQESKTEFLEFTSRNLVDGELGAEGNRVIRLVKEGNELYYGEEYSKAIEAYDAALAISPKDSYIINVKGWALYVSRRYPESLEAFQRGVELRPEYAWGHFDLARAQCANGDFDDAEKSLRDAIDIRPGLVATIRGDSDFKSVCSPIIDPTMWKDNS